MTLHSSPRLSTRRVLPLLWPHHFKGHAAGGSSEDYNACIKLNNKARKGRLTQACYHIGRVSSVLSIYFTSLLLIYSFFHAQCHELAKEDEPDLELTRLAQLKKDVSTTQLAKDSALKVKVEDDKVAQDVVAVQAELVADL